MRIVEAETPEALERLDRTTFALDRAYPELSSRTLLSNRQRVGLVAVVFAVVVGCIVVPLDTGIFVLSVAIAVYLWVVFDRIWLFKRSMKPGLVLQVSDDEARRTATEDPPNYTVLVPLYREPEVVGDLIGHLADLEYPRDRLDIKLILESDDQETIDAVEAVAPGPEIEVVLVPPSQPRTKPKALDYALDLARGEIVTIFDAEDCPEPLQLLKAATAFRTTGSEFGCLQAKLVFANSDQNLLTGWFAIEYATWFSFYLPGLVAAKGPIPLGGTSNHIRREVLDDVGGWDPFNVTEDADLGIRLARLGHRCGVLDSITYEEANSDFINWVKQRSRWHKGYLQTAAVNLRRPVLTARQLGARGMLQLLLFVGGTPIIAAANPIFWALILLWYAKHPHVVHELFPAPLFYAGLVSWVLGNFLIGYLSLLTIRILGKPRLVVAALLVPLYWVMMAIAAVKAVWQLVRSPSLWEKTAHGLGGS